MNQIKIFPTATQTWQILDKNQQRQAVFLLFLMVVGMGMETISIGLIVPIMTLLAQPSSGNGWERYIGTYSVGATTSQIVLVGIAVLAFVYIVKTAFLAYQYWTQSKFIFDVQAVGIMGPSGAGKSTLVDIIIGLLLPTSGSVRIDGEDIRKHIKAWHSRIGYVPQSIYLTDDTLRANVAFGVPPEVIDEDQVSAALKSAQLEEFAASLPLGYETIVGERGVKLSGGQRQRIGIARALYNNPDVLVLDEATSALDIATEAELMKSVNILKETKTIIIVAHRFATLQDCDRIFCIEKGRIIKTSTPEEMREYSMTGAKDTL